MWNCQRGPATSGPDDSCRGGGVPGTGGTSESEGGARRRKKLLARETFALSARRAIPLFPDAGIEEIGGISEVLDGEIAAAGELGISSGLAVSVGMLLRVFIAGSDREAVIRGGPPFVASRFDCVLAGDSVMCSALLSFSKSIGLSTLGFASMPVAYFMNVDIARKQNLPGVVNANRIGSVCAQSIQDRLRT